jgi:hypothetical protein
MDTVFISITEKDMYGNADTDSADLYNTMNVSEQDSSMGKGKSIVTPEKDFTLICTKEKKTCTILIRKSARTEISADRKYASIKISGDDAAAVTEKFKLNDNREAFFQSSDKIIRLSGTADSFIFESSGE